MVAMAVKGQFFTITAILILIVIASIIEFLTIPLELSSEQVRYETNKFIEFKSLKTSAEEILNQIRNSWILPEYNYKISLKLTNSVNESFEDIPITAVIDFNEFTNPDSIRVFNGISETPSQVEWSNFSSKEGTVYFYSSFKANETKDFTIFYNTFSKEIHYSPPPSYENINITKQDDLINISAKRYLASINLTAGGVIKYLLNRVNNENICSNCFMINSSGFQNLVTSKVISETHNPVFSEIKIETKKFGENNATANITYRFFDDRITALMNVTYDFNSTKIELFNYFACKSDFTMKMKNVTQTEWCSTSQSNEIISNKNDSWILFYSNNESFVFFTNFTKWDYAGSEPQNVIYGTVSGANSYSYFKSEGTNLSGIYAEITLYFNGPGESGLWPVYHLLRQSLPWDSKQSLYDLDDSFDKRCSFLENENSLMLKELKIKKEEYNQIAEGFAYQENWYSSPFRYRNITLLESNGTNRLNITIILSVSSNDTSKDILVPIDTKTSSFRLYDSQNNKVLINLTWENEALLNGNISFLVNLTANQKKYFYLYCSSIKQVPFEYEKNTADIPAVNVYEYISAEKTLFKNDFSYRIPFYIQDIGDIKRTNWVFEQEFFFTKDANPSSIYVIDESNEILPTDVSTDNLNSFSEFGVPVKDYGDGLVFKLINLENRAFNISVWKFNSNETESPNTANISITGPGGGLINVSMNSNISTYGIEHSIIMINSSETGTYNVIVNASIDSSIKINSTLPKIVYEKNSIVIGKLPFGSESASWNGSFIIHVPESENSLNITVKELGSATTGKINITYENMDIVLSESVPTTQTSYLKTLRNFKDGRFLKASIASNINSSVRIIFSNITNIAYNKDYYLDFNKPKLNVLFVSSLTRNGYKKHWVYFDSFKREKIQSTDLNENGLKINNSYISWDFPNNNFTLSNGINWFNTSLTWFSAWNFGINKTTSSSSSLSGLKLTQSNSIRKVIKASSGTNPNVDYFFNIYAYSPLIKVVIKGVDIQYDFSMGPYWMINNDADNNFTYRFGNIFTDNNQETSVNYYNLTCKDYTWFFKNDYTGGLGIIVPCNELLAVKKSFYMVDNLGDALTTVSIKGRENNYIYLLPTNNTSSNSAEEALKRVFYKNIIKQLDKLTIRYYTEDSKITGEIVN